jgi:hypothetical protein
MPVGEPPIPVEPPMPLDPPAPVGSCPIPDDIPPSCHVDSSGDAFAFDEAIVSMGPDVVAFTCSTVAPALTWPPPIHCRPSIEAADGSSELDATFGVMPSLVSPCFAQANAPSNHVPKANERRILRVFIDFSSDESWCTVHARAGNGLCVPLADSSACKTASAPSSAL